MSFDASCDEMGRSPQSILNGNIEYDRIKKDTELRRHLNQQCKEILSVPLYDDVEMCYARSTDDPSITTCGVASTTTSSIRILENYVLYRPTQHEIPDYTPRLDLVNELCIIDNLVQERAEQLLGFNGVTLNSENNKNDVIIESYVNNDNLSTAAIESEKFLDEKNMSTVGVSRAFCDEPKPSTSKQHQQVLNPIHGVLIDNRIQEIEMHIKTLQEELNKLKQIPKTHDNQSGSGNGVDEANSNLRHVILRTETKRYFKRFNIRGRDVEFSFKQPPEQEEQELKDRILWLERGIGEVLDHVLHDVSDNHWVGMLFTNQHFIDKPVAISFRKKWQLSAKVIMDVIYSVVQSNNEFFFADYLGLAVSIVPPDRGFGRQSVTHIKNIDYEVFRRENRGIICVENKDNMCLARALVLAIELCKGRSRTRRMRKLLKNNTLLTVAAKELCREANIDLTEGGGDEELQGFQNYLNDYTIIVFNSRSGKTKRFQGPLAKNRIKLYLYYENNHFDVIKNLPSTFGSIFFCDICCVRFNEKKNHVKCPYICLQCRAAPKCEGNVTVSCKNCRRNFYGDECFSEHVKNGLCSKLKRCDKCFNLFWTCKKVKHVCGVSYCQYCKKSIPFNHLCYMQPLKENKTLNISNETNKRGKRFLLVFFDFESTQNTKYDETKDDVFLHRVNLCVVQQTCSECVNIDEVNNNSICISCGQRQHVFDHDPVSAFLSYIAEKSKFFVITAIAHNNSNYDGCFILQKMMENVAQWCPNVIRNGAKLLSIKCGDNIKFVDSLNFIPLPLAKLPSTFKFEGGKGYFPHFFNTADNQNYIGSLPDKKYYGYDKFHETEREKFLKWYDEQKRSGAMFVMRRDLLKYCVDDVNILRRACIKFRSIFIKLKDVDPFQEALTMPSVCSLVFRKCFLKENTVAIIPYKGYRRAENQSMTALKWLGWVERTQNIVICHSGHGREVRLANGILVDGFCDATQTAYQYHGCYHHGCIKCYPVQTVTMDDDEKKEMCMKRENTIDIEKRIRNTGCNLVVLWGCEFKNMLKTDADLRAYVKSDSYLFGKETLNPRDAFFGGRTNAVKLYYKCNDDEKIHYYDFCSLYPYINKYAKYPIGHPTIYVGHEECSRLDFDSLEGLIKCTILPPNNLYHPLLPCKFNGKLVFTLCRTCMEIDNKDLCIHDESERKLSGTWTTDEIKEALLLGYRLLNINEIWHYQIEQYNPETKEGGLFTEYINTFLKIKQESSGWPAWVKCDADKNVYIKKYFEKEGILLERDNIVNNPGLRYISKQLLNSFWGKFGQKENKMHTKIVCNSEDMYRLLNDPAVNVHNMTIINAETLLVTWDNIEEEVVSSKNTNVVLAVMTTAAARLKLYRYLNLLDRRILYFDTDSIIFTSKSNEFKPPVDDYLGDFNNECEGYGEGSYITEFVSGGPKNYAFRVYTPKSGEYKTVCKVKGITLNYENAKIVNFSSMLDIVCNGTEDLTTYNDKKIARTKNYDVISRPESKIYRLNYTKRKRIPDSYDTLPFGFNH